MVPDEHVERVVAALGWDLAVTLGWDVAEAEAFVRQHGSIAHLAELEEQDARSLAANALESIQHSIHGQGDGLDNLWPRCPKHGTHPLFIDFDVVWRCPAGDHDDPDGYFGGVPVGWLDVIWPAADGSAS